MANSDPIADMLTRIRNANRVGQMRVNVKRSKVCLGIAQVLKDEGFISDYQSIDDTNQGEIRIDLKVGERKPGCRQYRAYDALPKVLDGLGIAVVSTSQGVMSDRKCKKMKVGGEVLCTVY
jgi:small subunit ribosomal protein S8